MPAEDIRSAESSSDFKTARRLFEEYAASIGIDLCFQNFDGELETLGTMYAPPRGGLLLAARDGRTVGCAAFRPFRNDVCEMKRLYVRPEARGARTGRRLAERIIEKARAAGYRTMVLDTLESMEPARNLYRSLGFCETPPYYENPIEGAVYMALELDGQ